MLDGELASFAVRNLCHLCNILAIGRNDADSCRQAARYPEELSTYSLLCTLCGKHTQLYKVKKKKKKK